MATIPNFLKPPPVFNLPLTKGQDLYVKIVYRTLLVDEEGAPVLDDDDKKQYVVTDYPEGATVSIIIDTTEPTEFAAEIDGSVATILGDYLITDAIKPKLLWRAKMVPADDIDKVLCNGLTTREDGQKKT